MAYIWQLSTVQLGERTWIEGTILSGKEHGHSTASSIVGNTAKILRSYFQPVYNHRTVYIQAGSMRSQTATDSKGYFSLLLNTCIDTPIKIISDQGEDLPIPQEHPTFFKNTDSPFEVISDLDDTVLLSHTASLFKRISTILFVLPKKRKPIVFTYELFQYFEESSFRITYLSKSESNLFSLITRVLQYNNLPAGPLLLTPYLKLRQLFNPKKGKNYKLKHLETYFENLPHKKFILLGDDTQKDMEVYTEIVKKYPQQVLMIYIRQTGFNRTPQQQALWQNLSSTDVPAMYFNDGDSADEALMRLDSLLED